MKQFYLGIDVGKEAFTVALLGGEQSYREAPSILGLHDLACLGSKGKLIRILDEEFR